MAFRVAYNEILFLLSLLFISGCAQQSTPQGGPRDEISPIMDIAASTPNNQVFFEKQDIKIVFDEFVDINQPGKSVLISPPMDMNPRIYARGKEIRVEMPEDEQLKENATYVFNFGNSIRDYTEGNEVENFSFIFSTGPYIDSLSISGIVLDSYTGEPATETLVMLYEELGDSVVYNQRPFYFTRTNENGTYEIQNLRADTFKIFALKDGNVNYFYDLDTELIGFLDSLIVISDQTDKAVYDLETFLPILEFDMLEYDAKTYGKTELIFNQAADSVNAKPSIEMDYFHTQVSGDSLIIWYDQSADTGFDLFIEYDTLYYDTLKIRKLSKSEFVKENKFEKLKDNAGRKELLKPTVNPIIYFNSPILNIDQSKSYLFLDSTTVVQPECIIDSLNPAAMQIKYNFEIDSSYIFTIDSGAVTNIYNQLNDSLSINFTIANENAYGKMIIFIDSLDFTSDYILELMSGDNVVKSDIITSGTKELSYDLLDPKTYSLRLVKDDNKNGRWDPGSYEEKRFSEKIATKELEAVREGWENELRLSMDIFNQKTINPAIEELLK